MIFGGIGGWVDFSFLGNGCGERVGVGLLMMASGPISVLHKFPECLLQAYWLLRGGMILQVIIPTYLPFRDFLPLFTW